MKNARTIETVYTRNLNKEKIIIHERIEPKT